MPVVRLAVDVDGVLANFTHAASRVAHRMYGLPLDYVPTDWNYSLSEEQVKKLTEVVYSQPNLWLSLPAYWPNVKAMQNFLLDHPFTSEVYYVTSRVETPGLLPERQTREWLRQHGLLARNCTVVRVPDTQSKWVIYKTVGIQFSVDDHAPTVAGMQGRDGHHAYLLRQPWNMEATDLPTVNSLEDYLHHVACMMGEGCQ